MPELGTRLQHDVGIPMPRGSRARRHHGRDQAAARREASREPEQPVM